MYYFLLWDASTCTYHTWTLWVYCVGSFLRSGCDVPVWRGDDVSEWKKGERLAEGFHRVPQGPGSINNGVEVEFIELDAGVPRGTIRGPINVWCKHGNEGMKGMFLLFSIEMVLLNADCMFVTTQGNMFLLFSIFLLPV